MGKLDWTTTKMKKLLKLPSEPIGNRLVPLCLYERLFVGTHPTLSKYWY